MTQDVPEKAQIRIRLSGSCCPWESVGPVQPRRDAAPGKMMNAIRNMLLIAASLPFVLLFVVGRAARSVSSAVRSAKTRKTGET